MSKLLEDLLKVVQPVIYRCVHIYPEPEGKFKVMGKVVDSLLHAKSEIDVSIESLQKSVDKMNAFTPENIIERIDEIGPWSLYGLAEIAIKHYYENEYEERVDEWGVNSASIMSDLCNDWRGIVVRYQKEVGYQPFAKGYVNEY